MVPLLYVFVQPCSTQVTSMQPLWQLQSIVIFGIMAKSSHGLDVHAEHLVELDILLEPQVMGQICLQCVSIMDFTTDKIACVLTIYYSFERARVYLNINIKSMTEFIRTSM